MKKRIDSFDLIRAFSAIVIVIYHYACSINNNENWRYFPFFHMFRNGNWGEITTVSIFFVLSGASLSYNYDFTNVKEVLTFYKKRWLNIFPTFYIVWLFIYIKNVMITKKFFYAGDFPHMLLSFVGMDGYFYYKTPTYYSVGEWFLGAIILLYLFFPLLRYLLKRFAILTTIVLSILLTFVLKGNFFEIPPTRNLITCIFAMWLGMLFIKNLSIFEKHKNIIWMALIGIAILLVVKIPINQVVSMIALGCCIFLLLFYITPTIYKILPIRKCVTSVSKVSYQIFILHHVIIFWVLDFFNTFKMGWRMEFLILSLIIIYIYIFSQVLYLINEKIVECLKNIGSRS